MYLENSQQNRQGRLLVSTINNVNTARNSFLKIFASKQFVYKISQIPSPIKITVKSLKIRSPFAPRRIEDKAEGRYPSRSTNMISWMFAQRWSENLPFGLSTAAPVTTSRSVKHRFGGGLLIFKGGRNQRRKHEKHVRGSCTDYCCCHDCCGGRETTDKYNVCGFMQIEGVTETWLWMSEWVLEKGVLKIVQKQQSEYLIGEVASKLYGKP